MEIAGWEERYRSGTRPSEDTDAAPTPLLVSTARELHPGAALDLACGAGRNAVWLAKHGWNVTAVDGSAAAIQTVRRRAEAENLPITTRVADLTGHEFRIAESAWDLIAICYYLQRDLIETAKRGVKPGGVAVVIVHITEADESPTAHRVRPGELAAFFAGWELLHFYEGSSRDAAHRRDVAEIVARRPRGAQFC